MFEILIGIVFLWLFFKAFRLIFKIAWGAAKIVAFLLVVLALPALVLLGIFAGGLSLLIPIVMILIAVGIIKAIV